MSKTVGSLANLAKDSQTDINIAGSKGMSPNMNCSMCKKWLSIRYMFETSGVEKEGDWKYSAKASSVTFDKMGERQKI